MAVRFVYSLSTDMHGFFPFVPDSRLTGGYPVPPPPAPPPLPPENRGGLRWRSLLSLTARGREKSNNYIRVFCWLVGWRAEGLTPILFSPPLFENSCILFSAGSPLFGLRILLLLLLPPVPLFGLVVRKQKSGSTPPPRLSRLRHLRQAKSLTQEGSHPFQFTLVVAAVDKVMKFII